jgi:hypothetical protein
MTKQLLTIIFLSPFYFTNAQSVVSTDSITIFKTEEDNLSRGRELHKTRGYVSDISVTAAKF